LSKRLRGEFVQKQDASNADAEKEWDKITMSMDTIDDIGSYRSFLEKYPSSPRRQSALDAIAEIEKRVAGKRVGVDARAVVQENRQIGIEDLCFDVDEKSIQKLVLPTGEVWEKGSLPYVELFRLFGGKCMPNSGLYVSRVVSARGAYLNDAHVAMYTSKGGPPTAHLVSSISAEVTKLESGLKTPGRILYYHKGEMMAWGAIMPMVESIDKDAVAAGIIDGLKGKIHNDITRVDKSWRDVTSSDVPYRTLTILASPVNSDVEIWVTLVNFRSTHWTIKDNDRCLPVIFVRNTAVWTKYLTVDGESFKRSTESEKSKGSGVVNNW
jgi:hypothetical protein